MSDNQFCNCKKDWEMEGIVYFEEGTVYPYRKVEGKNKVYGELGYSRFFEEENEFIDFNQKSE